ncbi:MAG: hypothetical protein M0Z92_05840 [Actinomycetota bacterium]|nr:hypothetical protein [Actinomycetota bacterium]
MAKWLKSRDRVERWFLAGGVVVLGAMAAGSAGVSRPVLLALGFTSAALMVVGYGFGAFEVFFRSNA